MWVITNNTLLTEEGGVVCVPSGPGGSEGPTYSISGLITDESDQPLAGVAVSSNARTNTTTNASGVYTLTGLTEGTYNVIPAADGYIFSPTVRSVVLLTDTTGVDFVGVPGTTYAISGVVQDREGRPVAGLNIALDTGQNIATDAGGAYTLTGVITGTYAVIPGGPALAFLPETGTASVPPNALDVDFVAMTLITGMVTDKDGHSIIGAEIVVRQNNSSGDVVDTQSTTREPYHFVDLPPGTYWLQPSLEGYYFAPPEATVTLTTPHTSLVESVVEQNFNGSTASYNISGSVTEAGSGTGIPQVMVSAVTVPAGTIHGQTTTAQDGSYTFEGLLGGYGYTITPNKNDYKFDPPSAEITLQGNVIQDFKGMYIPPPPPDPITTSGFKGANWLDFNDTYEKDENIGWNLELSDSIYAPDDPTGAQINTLYGPPNNIQTLVRLHVGPPIRNPGPDFINIPCDNFNNWMIGDVEIHYTNVMDAIDQTDSAPIFILGNEPNLDWGYTAEQYAHVFNCYYEHWRELGRTQWLFVAGPGDANSTFDEFYQELLNTGDETIADTDGFAIHAYGYCQDCNRHTPLVDDPDYAVINGVWESQFSEWVSAWNNAIQNRPDLQNRPVIITEYNPGAEDQLAGETLVNTIRRDDEPPHEELWQDWFEKTYCWARRITPIRGLLYFVDEGASDRNATTTSDWYPVSLESNPTARAAWLAAPSAGQTCQDILGATEPIGGQSLPTVGSIGGVISGTLGVRGFNNVFYVTDNLLVPAGKTLTVTMGTTLVFSPGLRLDVAGQLIAEGNNAFPVRFISTNDAGWTGLRFLPTTQGSRCLGCSLENLETGAAALTIEAPITLQYGLIRDVPNGTAISSTVPFTLSNLVIDYVGTGLRLAGSSAATYTVSHLSLGRCQQGIVNQGQSVTLENSILTTCDAAVSTELAGTTSISYTLLYNNGQNFVIASDSQLNQGPGLLMANPLFVDFPDNYQLQPDSPAVDAANPLSNYSQELGYNGGRADLGAYGNTWKAPQRPPLSQMGVTLQAVNISQVERPGQTITYTLLLQNSGTVTDSYTVRAEDSHTRFDGRLFESGYDGPRQIQLAPQQQISVTVWVTLPSLPTLGLSSAIPVQAFNGYGIAAEVVLTTSVAAFQEMGGQVVMEAEHVAGQTEPDGRSWLTQTVLAGYAGSGYLNSLLDTDIQFTTSYTTTSPELQYTINFTNTGVYTVWVRGYAPNGAGDSIYVGLNNQPAVVLSGFTPQEWSWAAKRADAQTGTVTLAVTEPGVHVLRLWQREDGLRLDKIVLTTNSGYNPAGSGPPESEFK